MIYTAVFQDSTGQLYSEVYNASPNRDVAWEHIHANRSRASFCLLLLVTGDQSILTHEDIMGLRNEY